MLWVKPVIEKYLIFSLALFFSGYFQSVSAKNDTLHIINNLHLGVNLQYGSVLPHHASIAYSLESNIKGIEITLATDTYGKSSWDTLYRYPRLGTGYIGTTLGNRTVFGTAHALFLFVDFPFSAQEKKFTAGYQVNFGIAYINKLYDVVENPFNMAVSTKLNAYASFRFYTRFLIGQKDEISASFGFSHFSNGKIVSPNLGINTGSFFLGYRRMISAPRYQRITENEYTLTKRHYGEVILSGGTKSDDQITGKAYFISTLTCDYYYFFSRKYGAGVGTDFFYDQAIGPNMVAQEGGSYSTVDLFQTGLHAALYAKYGKLYVIGNIGTYLYASYLKYTRVYTRLGLRYELTPHILLNLSLKAHYAIADYVEWGIGYRFN